MKRLIKLYVIIPIIAVSIILLISLKANAETTLIQRHGSFIKRINQYQAMVIINGTVSRCCTDQYHSYVVNGMDLRLTKGTPIKVTFIKRNKQVIDAWITEY